MVEEEVDRKDTDDDVSSPPVADDGAGDRHQPYWYSNKKKFKWWVAGGVAFVILLIVVIVLAVGGGGSDDDTTGGGIVDKANGDNPSSGGSDDKANGGNIIDYFNKTEDIDFSLYDETEAEIADGMIDMTFYDLKTVEADGSVPVRGNVSFSFGLNYYYGIELTGVEAQLLRSSNNDAGSRFLRNSLNANNNEALEFPDSGSTASGMKLVGLPFKNLFGNPNGIIDFGYEYRSAQEVCWLGRVISEDFDKKFYFFNFDLQKIQFAALDAAQDIVANGTGNELLQEIGSLIPVVDCEFTEPNLDAFLNTDKPPTNGGTVSKAKGAFGKFLWYSPAVEIALEPTTPVMYFSARRLFPAVPVPVASTGFFMFLQVTEGALGFSDDNKLKLNPTEDAKEIAATYRSLPDEITGNMLLSGAVTLGLTHAANPKISVGVALEAEIIVDVDWIELESNVGNDIFPLPAITQFAATGELSVIMNLPFGEVQCPISESFVYLGKNEDSLNFVFAARAPFLVGLDGCSFGSIDSLIVIKPSVYFTFYMHMMSNSPADVSGAIFRASGSAGFLWKDTEKEIGAFVFEVDLQNAEISFSGMLNLELNKFIRAARSEIAIAGTASADSASFSGSISFEVITYWWSIATFSLEAKGSIEEGQVIPDASLSGTMSYETPPVYGGYSELFDIDIILDGDEGLTICSDSFDDLDELSYLTEPGADGKSCFDAAMLDGGITNGKPCFLSRQCQSGRCETEGARRICLARMPAGSSCNEDDDCLEGLYCSSENFRCRTKKSAGEFCNGNSSCQSNSCRFFVCA